MFDLPTRSYCNNLLMDWLPFERSHLAQPADVAFFLGELGSQESIHQFSGDNKAHHPAADTEDVHIVVLDSLVSRVVVLNQPGADARNFVGTDRGPYPTAADRDAALHFPRSHSLGERDDEVGIVVAGIQAVCPHIDHLVPSLAKMGNQFFLQTKATVICGDSQAHLMLSSCIDWPAVLLPRRLQSPELAPAESDPPESGHRHSSADLTSALSRCRLQTTG